MIVSWAIKNNFLTGSGIVIISGLLRIGLVLSMMVVVSWAIENNIVYFWGYSSWSLIVIVFLSYSLVAL